jgi:predicted Rossmann-fold nucleotide-binding protein
MGAVAKAAKDAGGRVIGVLPEKVHALGHYDPEIEMLVAKTMAERKQHFWDRADAFLCLPGSYGSMDELFEILTLTKLGYMPAKPIVVFNHRLPLLPKSLAELATGYRYRCGHGLGYYDGLKLMIDQMTEQGFMGQDRANLVMFANDKESAARSVICGF